MICIDKSFMYNGVEYKITYFNKEINKLTLEPTEVGYLPEINTKIKIEDRMYKVVYVNSGKNRVSIILI